MVPTIRKKRTRIEEKEEKVTLAGLAGETTDKQLMMSACL